MEGTIPRLCLRLARLGQMERAYVWGYAQALAQAGQRVQDWEEREMQRREMVYHGGKRTCEQRVALEVRKQEGSDRFVQVIEASSTAAAMDALEALIRGYEAWLGVPAHHVLAVLATVMTAPGGGRLEG